MSPLCNELENRISADDELQMCTVADEPRTVAFMMQNPSDHVCNDAQCVDYNLHMFAP